ncbi:hypothetical protein [Microcoleus sp. LAD1_D5]
MLREAVKREAVKREAGKKKTEDFSHTLSATPTPRLSHSPLALSH